MSTQNVTERLAEAAGYALLRRLAPMLSHNLAGALQPLTMISTILEKRLQNPDPDLAALASKSSQLKTLTREASSACMGLMSWLAPHAGECLTVAAGVREAIELVMTPLSFKGFSIINKTEDVQVELPRKLIGTVYMAALLALTDAATAPADVILEAQLVESELVLTISLQPVPREIMSDDLASYRNIEWADVAALAEIHAVRLTHSDYNVHLQIRVGAASHAGQVRF